MRGLKAALPILLVLYVFIPAKTLAANVHSLLDLPDPRSTFIASGLAAESEIPSQLNNSRVEALRARSEIEGSPAWRGRMDPVNGRMYMAPSIAQNKCDGNQECNTSVGKYPYEQYIIDPTGFSNQPVLKIGYPKGSWSPNSRKPGGTLFYAYPYKSNPSTQDNPISVQAASLEFEVFFPPDFDFVKGGKLLGLSGGDRAGRGCGGGVDPDVCFSYRIMWRREGNGEAYVYAPEGLQREDFCTSYPGCTNIGPYPCTECNLDKGVSFGRGVFKFQVGEWQKIRMTVVLNDPDQHNGYLGLTVNGQNVIAYDGMRWRTSSNINIEAVEIASWFGGSDETWGPPTDTFVLIRNLKMFRTGPTTGEVQAVSLGMGAAAATVQTVVEEVIEAAD